MKWFLFAFLSAFPVLANPAIVQSEFIFESGPYPQVHATTIEETPGGLVAAWFGGTKEKHPDIGIWVSRHIDGKWTASIEVANGIQFTRTDGTTHRHPCWNPVLFQPKEGPLVKHIVIDPAKITLQDFKEGWPR